MKSRVYLKKCLRSTILAVPLVLLPILCSAASLTTDDGVVYENVTVISATPKDLLITYKSNGRNSAISIPLKSLPADIQKQYGYDPGKEASYKNAAMLTPPGDPPAAPSKSSLTSPAPTAKDDFTAKDSPPMGDSTLALPKERPYASKHPLYFRVVFGKEDDESMLGVLDESGGTGTGYDTAYMDENMNNDFTDEQPKMFPERKCVGNTTKLEPEFSFKGPLGKNGDADYKLDICWLTNSLASAAKDGIVGRQGVACIFNWYLNIEGWNYLFINGQMRVFSSAADALKGKPVLLGGECKSSISSCISEGKVLILAGLKDDNGGTLRMLYTTTENLSPMLALTQNGTVVLRQKMEFG